MHGSILDVQSTHYTIPRAHEGHTSRIYQKLTCNNLERSSRRRRSTSRERDRHREEKSKHRRDGGQGKKFSACIQAPMFMGAEARTCTLVLCIFKCSFQLEFVIQKIIV